MSTPPAFSGNISFNAQHSPMGAFMSVACGHFGSRGGIAAQIGKPGNQDLFIGVKDGGRFAPGPLRVLPFFSGARNGGAGAADFVGEQAGPAEQCVSPQVIPYSASQMQRHYRWATDQWVTDDFRFILYSPFGEIPDPATALPADVRRALLPAVMAELEVDNRAGRSPRTAFFAANFNEPGWHPLDCTRSSRRGFGFRGVYGIMGEIINPDALKGENDPSPALFCRWSPEQGIAEVIPHQLGTCPGLLMEVPPGERRVLRLALGCYLEGIVTTGIKGKYLYTNYFTDLDGVLNATLEQSIPETCERIDHELLSSGLSPEQQFQVAHGTRGYYGSTQLLDVGGKPFWIVNEGEYCMMNTLDLSVDHMFWELKLNPWVVRNLLDHFVRHYSYVDTLKPNKGSAGDAADGSSEPHLSGGLSFTHDMGAHNNFSAHGHSSYELPNLPAVCFSYMTAEQLCNWILVAVTYVLKTGDFEWARHNNHVLIACLDSLSRRGGESGIPEFDSSRCGTGAEITTYDSLDHSLAQTRNSLYMAVKFWASFRGLAILFDRIGEVWRKPQQQAALHADCAEQEVLRHVGADGVIPAVFEKDSSGYKSRILPAAEGLLYPLVWGLDVEKLALALFTALRDHTLVLLKDPQKRNLFPDGGIRLSSTSSNSWMSKIAIFMHVARRLFGIDKDPELIALFERADQAHVRWQTDGSGYWACSDQFIDGVAIGSRWYPRIITTTLWLALIALPVRVSDASPSQATLQ